MAVYLKDTAWDHLWKTHGLALFEPMTMCCWFRPKNITEAHPLVTVTKWGQQFDGWTLSARCDQANDPLYALEEATGGGFAFSAKNGVVANTWQHGASVFGSPDSRLAYLNGSAGNLFTGDIPDPPVSDLLQVGYYEFHGAHSAEIDVAEVAIWDIELGAAAIQDMHTNQLSAACYPDNLVLYHKLINDYVDEQGGPNFNTNGAPSFIAHPTIDYACGPIAPSGLVCSVVSSVQINLSWVDNSDDEDGFKIERSTDNVFWNQIATVGENVTAYEDAGLSPNETYYYRVRAYIL